MHNGKKNILFFTFITCILTSHSYSMEQARTSPFPPEISNNIIAFFFTAVSFTSTQQASCALRALTCINHTWNKQIENPDFHLSFIKNVADQLHLSDERVAHELRTPESKNRIKIQRELIVLCTETACSLQTKIINPKFEQLWQQGVDLQFLYGMSEYRSRTGETPLMIAAIYSSNLIYPMINKGAPINQTNRHGTSALMQAARCKSNFTIQVLLSDPSIYINQQDRYGNSAFMHYLNGLGTCQPRLVTLFLKAGADPMLKNNKADVPIERARHIHNPRVVKLIEEAVQQKMLSY